MKNNANVESPVTAATATEQKEHINPIAKKESNMSQVNSNQFSIDESTVISEMSQQQVIDFIADNIEAGYFPTQVMYSVYWAVVKEMSKKTFGLVGVTNFVIAEEVARDGGFDASKVSKLIHATADRLEGMYEKISPIADILNAGLNDIHQKRPTKRTNTKGERVTDEEFKPLAFEPFTRRTEMDGLIDEPELDAWDRADEDESDYNEYEIHNREVARFMQQHELKQSKANMSSLILGAKSDEEKAMQSQVNVIYEPITKQHWIEDMLERTREEILENATISGWAMLKALGRRFSENTYWKEIAHGTKAAETDWSSLRLTAGPAMSMAVKMKTRHVKAMVAAEQMEARVESMNEYRHRQEAEASGTISESSMPVSGSAHDERISEFESMIQDAYRESNALESMYPRMYAAMRQFGTTDSLDIPIPDYRSAFNKDPEQYLHLITAEVNIERIEIPVDRNGKEVSMPLWMITAEGSFDDMCEVERQVRAVRWEMRKVEHAMNIRNMAVDPKTGENKASTDAISAAELIDAIDSLLDV